MLAPTYLLCSRIIKKAFTHPLYIDISCVCFVCAKVLPLAYFCFILLSQCALVILHMGRGEIRRTTTRDTHHSHDDEVCTLSVMLKVSKFSSPNYLSVQHVSSFQQRC